MDRRSFLKAALALPLLPGSAGAQAAPGLSRVRPGQPGWPSAASWDGLNRDVGGRLIKLQSPLGVCQDQPSGAACREVFKELKNPYFIGDDPSLTQTTGWVDAWTSQPSVYAVAARRTEDVVAAVNFARENNLRLVVKGGGHSYLGTSNAPDSLLIWTRAMNDIVLHDAFVAQGCTGQQSPQPAVSVGAGAIWMHTYNEVTTKGGRYVQGGGCGTVGVAGLVQGGGFGSYSKTYGTAAASLLEAEIVTADGVVRIANACTNPDLFWALKGGGGGTFGVVTRVTLRTHELPAFFGGIVGDDPGLFRRGLSQAARPLRRFLRREPFQSSLGRDRQCPAGQPARHTDGLPGTRPASRPRRIWQPFLGWVQAASGRFHLQQAPLFRSIPARHRWDPAFLKTYAPAAVRSDDRPGAPDGQYVLVGQCERGRAFHSRLRIGLAAARRSCGTIDGPSSPTRLLPPPAIRPSRCISRRAWPAAPRQPSLRPETRRRTPPCIDAFALAIIASEGPPAYPGLRGHEPDLERRAAQCQGRSLRPWRSSGRSRPMPVPTSRKAATSRLTGRTSYWGANYPRLLAIKGKYDPAGLFFVHHGVGSEAWSADGFTRAVASVSRRPRQAHALPDRGPPGPLMSSYRR